MADIDQKLLDDIMGVLKGEGHSDDPAPREPSDGSKGDPTAGRDASAQFYKKWAPKTDNLLRPFNLLSSPKEDDFSGALAFEDDCLLDEFIDDLAGLLVSLGKLPDKKSIQRESALSLAADADRILTRGGGHVRDVVRSNRLIVVDGLSDFPPEGAPQSAMRHFFSTLGRIVDGRYILLVGTTSEVEAFIRSNAALSLTYGENVILLGGLDTEGIVDAYLNNLDEGLKGQAGEEFLAKLRDYIEFNEDLLQFKGAELADYLSKEANAAGKLLLPKDRYTSTSFDEMLDQVVGLDNVKMAIRNLKDFATFKKRAGGHGCNLLSGNMHMLFEGNPGTGKTMVARLIATMLFKIGITRTNTLVETSAKDLIGKYVGHTDKQVQDKMQEALGGVLFIDEAYALMPEGRHSVGYGSEAIAQLVKGMEDYKDDLIVIFAGYEHEMQELIDSNPGLASRIGYTFRFDDYSVEELLAIFMLKAGACGLAVEEGVEEKLRGLFSYFSRFKSFGNGRFVSEVLQKAIINHARSFADGTANTSPGYLTIMVGDIPTRQDMFESVNWAARPAAEQLSPLVGLDTIKEEVVALERTVAYRETALDAGVKVPSLNLNMVFRGNPGTGKTTVARIVASVLYNIGSVPSSHFEELEAKDLLSSARDDASTTTARAIERAMGGVLFLDEAYALMDDVRGRESLAVLVKAMEDHKGELVVMFAGYRQEMRAFIDENPGLASRIGYTFDFEDYNPDELLEIFRRKMDDAGFAMDPGVIEGARDAFRYFHSVENFGNGRFVDRYIQELIATHASHFDADDPVRIGADSLPTIKRLCELSATDVFDCTEDEEHSALRRVAIHEAGHAVCRLAATGKTDIVLITVEHEGSGALGYVQHEGSGVSLPTSANLRDEIVCLLGGMSAEEAYFGAFSAGNSSDLEKATEIVSRYVATYGMSDAGLVQFAGKGFKSTDVARLPDSVIAEMRRVLDECHAGAREIIERHRTAVTAIADALGERSTMTGEELLAVWERAVPSS